MTCTWIDRPEATVEIYSWHFSSGRRRVEHEGAPEQMAEWAHRVESGTALMLSMRDDGEEFS